MPTGATGGRCLPGRSGRRGVAATRAAPPRGAPREQQPPLDVTWRPQRASRPHMRETGRPRACPRPPALRGCRGNAAGCRPSRRPRVRLTFGHLVEDQVDEDVGAAPARAVAANRRSEVRGRPPRPPRAASSHGARPHAGWAGAGLGRRGGSRGDGGPRGRGCGGGGQHARGPRPAPRSSPGPELGPLCQRSADSRGAWGGQSPRPSSPVPAACSVDTGQGPASAAGARSLRSVPPAPESCRLDDGHRGRDWGVGPGIGTGD